MEKLRTAERFDEIRECRAIKSDIQLAREWLSENYLDGAVLGWERLTVRLGETAAGHGTFSMFARLALISMLILQCS